MDIVVKPIKIDTDLDKIKEVAEKAFSDTPDSSLDEWFSFDEMEKMIKEKRGICVKAEDEKGNILGMLYAQQENPINCKEGLEKWVIVIAATDPEFSGKGIGSKLLKEIENQAQQKGAKKMFVYTNKGDDQVINFYKKSGYEDAGWIKNYQYGKDNSAVFLLKSLN